MLSPVPNQQVKFFIEKPLENIGSRVIFIRQSLEVQIKVPPEKRAFVGDWSVGNISGKEILQVFATSDWVRVFHDCDSSPYVSPAGDSIYSIP
jgi:hypothetical protein